MNACVYVCARTHVTMYVCEYICISVLCMYICIYKLTNWNDFNDTICKFFAIFKQFLYGKMIFHKITQPQAFPNH